MYFDFEQKFEINEHVYLIYNSRYLVHTNAKGVTLNLSRLYKQYVSHKKNPIKTKVEKFSSWIFFFSICLIFKSSDKKIQHKKI